MGDATEAGKFPPEEGDYRPLPGMDGGQRPPKVKDRRTAAELERERAEQPFLLLKGYIPKLLYDAVVLIFKIARKFLSQRQLPDAREVAEDIASKFLHAEWKAQMQNIRDKSSDQVWSYCYKVAKRDCLDHLKDPRTRDHDRMPEDDEQPHQLMSDMAIERLLEIEGYAQDIERAIRTLKPEEEQVIRMRWKEEMAFPDIAHDLGISEDKARKLASRAYRKLRGPLEHLRTAYGRSAHV